MALVFRDAGAPPARVRPRGPLAHDQPPSFSWARRWRVGLPGRGAPRERAHTGEVKGLPPSLLHGALLATLGGPWDSSPILTSTQLCGVQAWPAGAELPSPGLTPGLTLGTAHCLHWAQRDGRAALPARRLRGPSSWGKSPGAVSWGKAGLARGGRMRKPQPLSSPLLPWIRQGEDQTKGLDTSWPRNRAVPAPRPRPGGLSLPTVCGAAALSPGTNATKPEWNRSNKQGLWQRERELLNPAWQLIKELIRRQGVRGDQGRAACRATSFQMSWAGLGPGRKPSPRAWLGRGCASPNSQCRAVREGSCGGFLLGCADCGSEQGAGAGFVLGVGFSSSGSRPRPRSGAGDSDTTPQ